MVWLCVCARNREMPMGSIFMCPNERAIRRRRFGPIFSELVVLFSLLSVKMSGFSNSFYEHPLDRAESF